MPKFPWSNQNQPNYDLTYMDKIGYKKFPTILNYPEYTDLQS